MRFLPSTRSKIISATGFHVCGSDTIFSASEPKSLFIREMAASERPREKLMKTGARYLSNSELLGVVIGSGDKNITAIEIAERLLNYDRRGLQYLADISCEELKTFQGIGDATACRIVAAMELAKRLSDMRPSDENIIESSSNAADLLMERLRYYKEEHFTVILLDPKGQVMGIDEVAVGDAGGVTITPVMVFLNAVKKGAAAVILAHNHPSGDPTPSEMDWYTTDRMSEAGRILGIKVIDHIVIGNGNYYSFKDNNKIN